ncbi:MAG: FtsX-like permease family protein [Byssovorax sp.]
MTFAGLAARNLLRNKVRTALTVMGVAVAVITFLMLRTVVAAWTVGADFAAKDRVVTRHKITFIMPLPLRYFEKIKQVPGVKTTTFANWFGGKDPKHDHEFFSTLAIDGPSYFDVISEVVVPPDQKAAFFEDRTGAVVGDVLAQKLGWKIGDKVTLESGIYPDPPDGPWTFTIRGIYTTTQRTADRSTLLFHFKYLNEAQPDRRKDQIGWIMSRVTDPTRTAAIGVDIDKVFEAEDNQTLSQDEHSFNTSFLAGISAVLRAIDLVSVAILGIMMLILGNTIAMGVRERTSEYGAMRAIGFLPKHIAWFVIGEATVLGALGGVVGIALGYPFLEKGLGRFLEENMGAFFPYFRVPPLMVVAAFFLAIGLGLAASLLPARQAMKLRVTEALRRIA